jgi:hypothetical protein
MKVKIFVEEGDRVPYVNGFKKEIAEKIIIPQYYPEGFFGLYGPPFFRTYEPVNAIPEDKFYYPIIVSLWLIIDNIEHLEIPTEIISCIKSQQAKILLVNPFEGWEWSYWESLVEKIADKFNLSSDDFVCLTGNHSPLTNLKSIVFNFWEFGYQYNLLEEHRLKFIESVKNLDAKPHKFICLNRRPHFHRLALVQMLFDIKDQGILTCAKQGAIAPEYFTMHLNRLQKYDEGIHDRFVKNILPVLPLTVDDGIDVEIENPALDTKYDKFFDSYIHVVTETFFEQLNNRMFFSEKAFKPMAMLQPFVFVGQRHSLKTLRDLGYKTFQPYIDESYDEIVDDHDRMQAVVKEIKRLTALEHDQLWVLIQRIRPIIEHNFLHIYTRADIIKEQLKSELIRGLEK